MTVDGATTEELKGQFDALAQLLEAGSFQCYQYRMHKHNNAAKTQYMLSFATVDAAVRAEIRLLKGFTAPINLTHTYVVD